MNFDDPPGSGYYCSFEKKNLDEAFILKELAITYWASSRPVIDTLRALDHSICCGVYLKDVTGEDKKDAQVGFGRVVTDYATFAWICDIIVSNDHRGKGLGKFLVGAIMKHPTVEKLPCLLRTHDAHELYKKFGFQPIDAMRRLP